ncbi:MAG TPA: polysaccharide biosynthesis tyrosine autokinase [Pseudacidobacterium sp.]|nr:polysaccharide biosynthesis tyrosine autokinase [Pseudacidobacterium sp.]
MNTVPQKELTLQDLLRIFDRRRYIFLGTAAGILGLAILACIFMTRRYETTGTVELQKSEAGGLDLESMMGSEASSASDALSVNLDLQTQTEILQSESLLLKVAKDLNLEQNADFKPRFNPIGAVMGLFSPKGIPDPAGASLEDSPGRRRRVLMVMNSHLKVKVTPGTRLITVSYSNPDPKVSAAVVNHLMQALIDFTFQGKYAAMSQVSDWLAGQLGSLRQSSEGLQEKVVQLQKETGLYGVGGTDLQGKPVVYSPALDRLQQSSAQLEQAQLNRILKQSVYEVAKTGNAELISQLSGTSLAGASSQGVANSLTLIQNLRAQESTLKAQIAQDASQFGPNFPRLIQERANLASTEQSLKDEINRIAERARNDFEVAQKAEEGSRKTYETDVQAAQKLNDKTIEFTLLSKEADESQSLYQDLLRHLKEAGILAGLRSSNLTIIDPARPPAAPATPKVPLLLGLGLGVGLFAGAGLSIAADAIDNKIQGIEDIEEQGLTVLGLLPKIKSAEGQGVPIFPVVQDSAYLEAIRSLRSTVLLSRSGAPPKILLVTSASPGEGKSTTSLNLAFCMAQLEKKVLLMEVDFRRPTLRSRLKLPGTEGISTALSGHTPQVNVSTFDGYPNLHLLPAGPVPPYPAEMISSAMMRSLIARWEQEYDFIILDCPPVLPVTDARLLMEFADTAILIARPGKTTRVALKRAYQLLAPHAKDQNATSLGVVLNAVSVRSASYYGYYGYYGSKKYEYGQKED